MVSRNAFFPRGIASQDATSDTGSGCALFVVTQEAGQSEDAARERQYRSIAPRFQYGQGGCGAVARDVRLVVHAKRSVTRIGIKRRCYETVLRDKSDGSSLRDSEVQGLPLMNSVVPITIPIRQ